MILDCDGVIKRLSALKAAMFEYRVIKRPKRLSFNLVYKTNVAKRFDTCLIRKDWLKFEHQELKPDQTKLVINNLMISQNNE